MANTLLKSVWFKFIFRGRLKLQF